MSDYYDDAHVDKDGKVQYTHNTKLPSFDIIKNMSKRLRVYCTHKIDIH